MTTNSPELPRNVLDAFDATTGFMPLDEGRALFEAACTARPGAWLEIGTYCGKSTVLLAQAAREVGGTQLVTVDHHHGSEENQPGWEWHDTTMVDEHSGLLDTLPSFRRTWDNHVRDVVSAVVATTEQVAAWWSTPVEFLFLDGNHVEEMAQHDYAAFAQHVAPGGLLAVHDVFPDPNDGGQAPWHVVERALAEGFEEVSVTGSLRVLRRA